MKSEKRYQLIKKLFGYLEKGIENFLIAFINTKIGQGFLSKIVNWFVRKSLDRTLRPLFQAAAVEIGYRLDVRDGHIILLRINEAREVGNAEDYDNAVDDLLGKL
jgi:hypothetical protein